MTVVLSCPKYIFLLFNLSEVYNVSICLVNSHGFGTVNAGTNNLLSNIRTKVE